MVTDAANGPANPSQHAARRVVRLGGTVADRNKLHDSVVSYYEAEIFARHLDVGARLPSEAEIARLFAVSTRTIREALQVLETKGLVQRRHGECAIVVRNDVAGFLGSLALTVKQLFSTDPAYFLELMDVRRTIEVDVVGRLAAPDGQMTEAVDHALAGMSAAAAAGDAASFTGFDAAFHLGLVNSTPNRVLHLLYGNLYGLISEVIQVTSRVPRKPLRVGYAEHAEIRQLIRDKDVNGVRAAMATHIEGSAGYLKIAIEAGQTGRGSVAVKPASKSRSKRRAVAS